jgi:calcineurin-like phosphoesterase family protein
LGNHDHHIQKNKNLVQFIFSSVQNYTVLDVRRPNDTGVVDKYSFVLFHFPIASWDGMSDGVIHLHGHCHLPNEKRIARGRAMDVGMDGNGLYPISMDEVLSILGDREIKTLSLPESHHEN